MSEKLSAIQQWLTTAEQPAYRFKQIEQAWYTTAGWSAVTALPLAIRTKLSEQFPWYSFSDSKVFTSPRDGTQKALLTLIDNAKIETVLMPNARGTQTVCVSAQVGCGMGCTFCATGTMGLQRNLTSDEIIDQVRFWQQQPNHNITNVVFMGMGEPLANYDAVKVALNTLIDKLNIGKTRIVLSTVAFPAGLKRLINDETFPDVRIAISLHAGTDATRKKIVPSHKHNSIKQIVQGIEQYLAARHNRRHHLTVEYVMLFNVNDLPSEATALVKTFSHLKDQVRFNLIPWNQTTAALQRSSEEHLQQFQQILEQGGLHSTVRYSKGLDITAACGQLAAQAVSQAQSI
ncbi:MAG: hypothetical protein ACD_43C00244G0004 [uncultured bacterium]|nr:MAG: hypothetical protein ACD_43C00244G0004 [uncultured bacterium]